MNSSSLLTLTQRNFCQARSNQPAPYGPRAQALLALDQGCTQQQAAEKSGLSLGQVRYCLRRFRAVSLDIFGTEKTKPIAPPQDERKNKETDKKKNKSDKKVKKLKIIKSKNEKTEKKIDKKKPKTSNKKDKKGGKKKGKKKKK